MFPVKKEVKHRMMGTGSPGKHRCQRVYYLAVYRKKVPGLEQTTVPSAESGEKEKRYRISPGYLLREIAGEYAIVPVDSDGVFSNAVMAPNETAAAIWKIFREPHTVSEAVHMIREEYEVPGETAGAAIRKFIEESSEYGIIKEDDGNEENMD